LSHLSRKRPADPAGLPRYSHDRGEGSQWQKTWKIAAILAADIVGYSALGIMTRR
jgi:hypothetical protein